MKLCADCRERPARINGLCQRCNMRARRAAARTEAEADRPGWQRQPDRWMQRAACLDKDLEIFFNVKTRVALDICRSCPVIARCRDLADRAEAGHAAWRVHGVYGGETAGQRVARRSREARANAAGLPA